MDSLFFTKITMLVKKHVYPIHRAAQIRHFTRLARGPPSVAEPNGAGDMPPYTPNNCHVFFQAENVSKPFFGRGSAPDPARGAYDALPDPIISIPIPFDASQEGAPSAWRAHGPKGVKTALCSVTGEWVVKSCQTQ